ncbi:EF hand domain-containing protein [Luteimonas cucumeris]|uniref:EF hand domain-containing protein n=1 Tax=Luteimonas cucumeris TaxID=985012 RepID=A0A562L2I8_9GAMM|nr:EF-hand domain-containing protein [Luteimonas cucumeris]TWI01880.1 EF hand domain-containing protein [Luteimonas cucumeris]
MKTNKRLIPLLALTATLAAPLAFAQSTTPTQSAEPTAAPEAAAQAAPAAGAKTKTWADVDSDKDGKISKAESAAEPAVGQIFDQADADKDGNLTTDEYKAFVAKANGAPKADQGG